MDKIEFLYLKKMLSQKGFVELKVKGTSMRPLISENDIIKIEELKSELKIFDIIVFYQDQKLIVHYFWQKNKFFNNENENILTRPLNPISGYDFPIRNVEILGIVTNFRVSTFLKLKIILNKFFA